MENDNSKILREHLTELIVGGNAHATFEDAVADLPAKLRGEIPEGLPYSIWQLVQHIRIAQRDILDFTKDQTHQSPQWPDGYWSKELAPVDDAAWDNALKQIDNDKQEFLAILNDAQHDIYAPLPRGEGQTILREAILIGDHNAYHTAEIIVLRRLLGAWQ